MYRISAIFLLLATFAYAQTSPAPAPPASQTARQALLEMLTADSPDALQRHLMKNTLAAINKVGDKNTLTGGLGLLMLAKATGALQTFDSGPTLLRYSDPKTKDRLEVLLEKDEPSGNRDLLQLAFRYYPKGSTKAAGSLSDFPVVPRLGLAMQQEDGIWKLADITVSVSLPISDQAFLDSIVKQALQQQKRTRETAAMMTLQALAQQNVDYAGENGASTCDMDQLTATGGSGSQVDAEKSYRIAISACVGKRFRISAVPLDPAAGFRAFCTDQTTRVRYSADGKAATCFQSGKPAMGDGELRPSTGIDKP